LRQKHELTDAEIYEFQVKMDDFIIVWFDLNGRKGITNYIHLLASGHVCDFLMYFTTSGLLYQVSLLLVT
jgi:hypothetical protein